MVQMVWCLAPNILNALYFISKFASEFALSGLKWLNGADSLRIKRFAD